MTMGMELLSFANPVFAGYAFYGVLLVFKMFLVALWTVKTRIQKQVYANDEDALGTPRFLQKLDPNKIKPNLNDPDVERIRRLHRNDLENIPSFLLIGLVFVLSQPNPQTALWIFRVFFTTRVLHTCCYLFGWQPFRGVSFITGTIATITMGVQILIKACS